MFLMKMQTGSLEHTRSDVADAVVRHALDGTRHVVVQCAAAALRRMIVEDVIVRLAAKCIILSPNTAVQARWLDRQGSVHGVEEAARSVWGEHATQLVSPVPLSNAPVLTLTWQQTAAVTSPDATAQEAERLLRHFVKHSYTCIVVDGALPATPLWTAVLEGLRQRVNAFVLQLDDGDPDPATLLAHGAVHDAFSERFGSDVPVLGVPLPVAVRSRLVMPVRHLAWIADETITGICDVLADEHAERRENLRAIVAHELDITDESMAGDTTPRVLALLAAVAADPRTEMLHPVIATGATLLCADSRVIPLLSEAQTLVRQRGWDVRLTTVPHGAWTELDGSGGEWNSRTYMHLVSWLLVRGATRCLIADPTLLSRGWEALTPTTIVDCARGALLTLHQGDGVHPLDENALCSAVNHWSVIATSEDGTDIPRAAARLAARFTPADDDVLETGLRDLDRLAADTAAGAPPGIDAIERHNLRMRARIPLRDRCAAVWRAVPVSRGRIAPSLVLAAPLVHSLAHVPFAIADDALARDLETWAERRGTQRFRYVLWGVLASGTAMAAVLLLPLVEGGVAAAACMVLWMVLVAWHGLSIRGMRPRTAEADGAAVALRLAEAVRRTLMETGLLHHQPPATVEAVADADGALRIHLDAPWDARVFIDALASALPHGGDAGDDGQVTLFTVDHLGIPLRTLRDDDTRARLRVPALTLPLPRTFADDPAFRDVYLDALRHAFGAAEWRGDNTTDTPSTQHPEVPPERRWIWV